MKSSKGRTCCNSTRRGPKHGSRSETQWLDDGQDPRFGPTVQSERVSRAYPSEVSPKARQVASNPQLRSPHRTSEQACHRTSRQAGSSAAPSLRQSGLALFPEITLRQGIRSTRSSEDDAAAGISRSAHNATSCVPRVQSW